MFVRQVIALLFSFFNQYLIPIWRNNTGAKDNPNNKQSFIKLYTPWLNVSVKKEEEQTRDIPF